MEQSSLFDSPKSEPLASRMRPVNLDEFPICMECELLEGDSNWGIVGKVVNTLADEEVMNGDNVDISLLEVIAFDPYTHGYYKVEERVGNAFKDGLELK